MNKFKGLILAAILMLVLAACGGGNNGSTTNGEETVDLSQLAGELTNLLEDAAAQPQEGEEINGEEVVDGDLEGEFSIDEGGEFELNPEEFVGSELEDLIATFQTFNTSVETPRVDFDFDGDGDLDIAIVVDNLEENENGGIDRGLLLALNYGDGTYHFPEFHENIILSSDEGGVMGDPFMGLSLDEEMGMLGINHYGGSNYRWSHTYHIAYMEQGWSIVAYSQENFNTNDLSGDSLGFDLQMGEGWYDVTDSEGNTTTHFPSANPHGTVLLYDFDREQFDLVIADIIKDYQ